MPKQKMRQIQGQSQPRRRSTRGRGPLVPLAPLEEDISAPEDHSASSESEAGGDQGSGLGTALHKFRSFRQSSDATALVNSLTSTKNGLLRAPEDQLEGEELYAEAQAETSRGIKRAAVKVGGRRVSAPQVQRKKNGKEVRIP